jgi:hypothetical protein
MMDTDNIYGLDIVTDKAKFTVPNLPQEELIDLVAQMIVKLKPHFEDDKVIFHIYELENIADELFRS